ncbi:MAG: hypothetical protein ABSG17_04950 [Spirochaetia bacterium]|jgi:hypothetical protein
MRIDGQLPQMMPTPAAATNAPQEVPGEREPDGDADDRGRVATQRAPLNVVRNDTLGNRVDLLA